MNIKKKAVELKTSEHTTEATALQKATDFLKSFMLGFELNDAIALLRLDDLYIESFEIKDGNNITKLNSISNCLFNSKKFKWRQSFQSNWQNHWRERKDKICN